MNDVRFALRLLAKSPGFTAVCVLTLGLAIGANTAIFSVVSAMTLKPLPYKQPEQIVRLYTEFPTMDLRRFWISPPEYFDLRRENQSFSELAAWSGGTGSFAGLERPVRVPTAYATHTLLPLLGVEPALGRFFTAAEDQKGDRTVVIIGHDLWKRAFGGNPDVIGRKTTLDAVPVTIIGVMPEGFDFPGEGVEAWAPLGLDPAAKNRGSHHLSVIARLEPGLSLTAARAQIDAHVAAVTHLTLGHHWHKEFHPVLVHSLTEEIVGPVRPALWLLMGAVVVVLLIAVANIANLLLARSESRAREVAVRAAVGADRARLIRQFLTESVVLGIAGGALGILLAFWGVDLALLMLPEGAPRAREIGIDGQVLGYAIAVSVGSGLLFGLAPVFLVRSDRLSEALKEGGRRSTGGRGGQKLRSALVAGETALALLLVVGCGVIVQSFMRLTRVDPGFDPSGALTFELELPDKVYSGKEETIRDFWLRAGERLRALPGVSAATASGGGLPPVRTLIAADLELVGRTHKDGEPNWNTDHWTPVGDDYFETMGVKIVSGRAFTPADDVGAPSVVIINQAFARKFYPGQDPLGKQVRTAAWEEKRDPQTIIGVAADVKQNGLDKPALTEIYFPLRQSRQIIGEHYNTMAFVLRTDGGRDPMSLAPTVQRVVRELDPRLPVAKLRSLDRVVWEAAAKPRFLTFLLSVFAGLALLLAAVGVYGVMSYTVAQRTHEIGIRLALGASPASIRGLVLKRALLLAAVGIAVGLAGALAFTVGLREAFLKLLYDTPLLDVPTLVVVPLVVLAVSALAAWFPARRATRVDPMTSLRSE